MTFFRMSIIIFIILQAFLSGCRTVRPSRESVFVADERAKNTPWTHTRFIDRSKDFQFAIVSDRHGGNRPGVFADAVEKVALLHPEFVMSIGDLVDGYTEDSLYLDRQWREVNRIISILDMPFFYLPGNHDISNPWMLEQWNFRFGCPYYHFKYKDVLFLCLNTEDLPLGRISDEQVAYFRDVVQQHAEVAWTLVFMHRPLWDYGDKAGYEKIEALLADRPYTVFSGHHHEYLKAVRNGRTHYVLGTTGGGSPLRGARMGEFDHFTWVTMTDQGPNVVHHTVDGIVKDDVVDDASYPMVRVLRTGDWLHVDPIVHDASSFTELTTTIRLSNSAPDPMHVVGGLESVGGIDFSPEHLDLIVPADSSLIVPLGIYSPRPVPIEGLNENPISVTLTAAFQQDGSPLSMSESCEVVMDWLHACMPLDRDIVLDGNLSDWEKTYMIDCRRPGFVKEDWDWNGVQDGWFRMGVGWHDDMLYLAVESFDDRLIIQEDQLTPYQDKFFLHVDGDPSSEAPSQVNLVVGPGPDPDDPLLGVGSVRPEGMRIVCLRKPDGLSVEVAIPTAFLNIKPGGTWESFRLNVGWMDHDVSTNIKPSVLWWRPPWGHEQDYTGSGTIVRHR